MVEAREISSNSLQRQRLRVRVERRDSRLGCFVRRIPAGDLFLCHEAVKTNAGFLSCPHTMSRGSW